MNTTRDNSLPPQGDPRGEAVHEPAPPEAAPPETLLHGTVAPAVAPAPETVALPEDLRAPWTWGHLAVFIVFALASLLGLDMIFLVVGLVKLHFSIVELQKLSSTSALYVTARQAIWFAGLMLYLFLATRWQHQSPFWRTIGWRPLRPRTMTPLGAAVGCLLGGFALAMTVGMAGRFVSTKAKLPIEELFNNRRGALLLMALAVLGAPLVEETVFRGYIYPVVARTFGVPAGVLVTGGLFGLMHTAQLGGAWGLVALLATVGVVLTYVRARTGTVLASYLLHLGYNTMLFVAFAAATHGFRHFPPPS